MSIEDWRKRIDEIDRKLLDLLNDRTQCVIEIGRIKKTQNVGVYDPQREREILRRMKAENHGPLDEEGLQRLFERVIDECRRIERIESEK